MLRRSPRLSAQELRSMTLYGAEAMLERLRADIARIERTFPALARASRRKKRNARPRRSTMSAAARKALSLRMKKRWAERRRSAVK